ncbi:hypothetical protein [uncultured Hoeflea sp.]|uniref:hypothetical protein n=1 Tax=uncultured Hoeflea sp. TaxID=538666 RepID=UPI0030D9616D
MRSKERHSGSNQKVNPFTPEFCFLLALMHFCFGASSALANNAEYFQVKQIVQSMMASGSLTANDLRAYENEVNSGRNEIYLHGCSLDFNTSFDGNVFNYYYIAFQVEFAKKVLSDEGYPALAWRDALIEFEDTGLRESQQTDDPYELLASFNLVAQKLAAELGASPRSNRRLSGKAGGECGDGGFTVEFVSEPDGARLWVLYEFDFLLCQAKAIDPWNISRGSDCPWMETSVGSVDFDSEVYVDSGNYRFVARWPDGHETTGRRKLRASDYIRDRGDVVVIRR